MAALVAGAAIVAVLLATADIIDRGSAGGSNFADSRNVAGSFLEALAEGDSTAVEPTDYGADIVTVSLDTDTGTSVLVLEIYRKEKGLVVCGFYAQ